MTKKDKIILYSSLSAFSISYIIYNNWKKKLLYADILKRIGGGSIKFDELPVWEASFLDKINSSGKAYAMYKKDVINKKAEELKYALSGTYARATEDEEGVYKVFEFFNSKVGVNQLVTFYNAKYDKSIKQELKRLFSDSEEARVSIIISRKPNVIFI